MGFITTTNLSGREVYCCEVGQAGCRRYPCKAHRCPFGWCQRYYICENCWEKPEVKARYTKAAHDNCRKNMLEADKSAAEKTQLELSGKFVRCAALSTDDNRVHVLFRRGEETIGRYMLHKTYDAIPLLVNATIEDYAVIEGSELLAAPAKFYN